jgi:hypothetical protein
VNWGDEDYVTHSATSPDGALRLEGRCHTHERAPASSSLRLCRASGGEEAVYLGQAEWAGQPVEFGPGESVALVVRYGTHHVPLRVDFRGRTFQLDPEGPAEPFDALTDRLRKRFPSPAASGIRTPPTARQLVVGFLEFGGGLLLCVACAWMLLGAQDSKARWIGGLGVLLFGSGAVFSLADLVRMIRARRR